MDIQIQPKPWYVKYRLYIIVAAIFVVLLAYLATLAFGPRRLRIKIDDYAIAEVEDSDFMNYVDADGIVQPIQTIQINTLESGYVERVVAEEGVMIHRGDTILVLGNPEMLRAIEDERTEWENCQRNYQEQELEMEQKSILLRQQALDARHQIARMEKTLRQNREEYRMGIKSKAELEVAEEEYDYQRQKSELQMLSLQHDSAATVLKRDMVRANREATDRKLRRATERRRNLVVFAPTEGQLSNINATIGQQLGSGNAVATINVLSQYRIQTAIPEYYVDRVTVGLPATVKYQGREFAMKISKVVPEVREHTFVCDLVFCGDMPSNIRLGKSYRVQIELGKPERALVVARGDFYNATSGRWIYRLSDDGTRAIKTAVEIGRQNPVHYEVIGGLDAGDKVIISGYHQLGDADELIIR